MFPGRLWTHHKLALLYKGVARAVNEPARPVLSQFADHHRAHRGHRGETPKIVLGGPGDLGGSPTGARMKPTHNRSAAPGRQSRRRSGSY